MVNKHSGSPLKLDAYIRVSSVRGRAGDSFIAPKVQRERIEAWAVSQGHQIVKSHEELDRSGGTVDRPMLNEVMRRIEDGETGGVVVFKLDRFGRTLIDSLGLIERIHAAGGTFASVSDGFDLTTENGRLVLRIMLSLAEWELERIRGNWAEARERAVARGLHLTAIVPFGYQRRADNGLEAHPINGPIVTELFERRAAGAGWADLIRWMHSIGARTQRDRAVWTLRALRDIVHSEVYLGTAVHGEFRKEGAHDALTDPVTWRRGQRKGKQTISRAAEPALLAGLLRCAGCRYAMRAATRKLADGRIVHDYRCRCGAEQAGPCAAAATATGTDGIEEFVIEKLREKVGEVELQDAGVGAHREQLVAERDRARDARDEYAADSRIQAAIGMDAYVNGLEIRQADYESKQAAVEAEADATDSLLGGAAGPRLLEAMSSGDLSVVETRRLLALAIDCAFIRRRDGAGPIADRTKICWRGTAPAVLPGQGVRGYVPEPFLF